MGGVRLGWCKSRTKPFHREFQGFASCLPTSSRPAPTPVVDHLRLSTAHRAADYRVLSPTGSPWTHPFAQTFPRPRSTPRRAKLARVPMRWFTQVCTKFVPNERRRVLRTFTGQEIATGRKVAIKKIKVGGFKDGLDMSAIREVKFLQELHHPNILEVRPVAASGIYEFT